MMKALMTFGVIVFIFAVAFTFFSVGLFFIGQSELSNKVFKRKEEEHGREEK